MMRSCHGKGKGSFKPFSTIFKPALFANGSTIVRIRTIASMANFWMDVRRPQTRTLDCGMGLQQARIRIESKVAETSRALLR